MSEPPTPTTLCQLSEFLSEPIDFSVRFFWKIEIPHSNRARIRQRRTWKEKGSELNSKTERSEVTEVQTLPKKATAGVT